tara:strand:+ start:198 stop:416 length:219 start_codon:yes stop_codon:yes gene_type:complete
MIAVLKWTSTLFVLFGILLTNLNIFPSNILIHGIGAIGWTVVGIKMKERAIVVNFGLQLPLFIVGYGNLILH